MSQEDDNTSAEESLEQFIQQVASTGVIWGLCSEKLGWANSESNDYEETDVILFWSDRASAALHQKDEWSGHVPTELDFEQFIEAVGLALRRSA